MENPLLRTWRLSTDLGGLVIDGRRLAVRLDYFGGGLSVFFVHQKYHAAETGKRILRQVCGDQFRCNAGGFQQTLHDQRFRLSFGIEHFYQLFVGVGFAHCVRGVRHASSIQLRTNRLRQSLGGCLAGHKGARPKRNLNRTEKVATMAGKWRNGGLRAVIQRGNGDPDLRDRPGGSMEVPQRAEPSGMQQSEQLDESRKIRRLQMMISMVMSVISQDPDLTVEEASEMAANARKTALAMLPVT